MKGNMITRRAALAGTTAVAMSSMARLPADAAVTPNGSVCPDVPRPAQLVARPQRAVSLRQVTAALKSGRPVTLEKLTRLDGYITDAANHDVVLWGLAEPGQPELQIPDFVVALRAAHGRYENTVPYISIDPDPAVFLRLKEIHAPDWTVMAVQDRYREVCKAPQKVRIGGMPHNTRVSKVLVDADYRMKMVGQGMVPLPISSPFPSPQQLRIEQWRQQINEGKTLTPHNPYRFWFEGGEFSYQASEDAATVFLDCAQVILNDEDQRIATAGLVASGNTDPFTRSFACSWTTRMEDVYKAEPIWREMHNMFRHFALARVMKDCDALTQVEFDSAFLLDEYQVPNVDVPASLPGLSRLDEIQVQPPGADRLLKTVVPVCGGVSVGFGDPLKTNPPVAETNRSGPAVLASRPTVTPVVWEVRPDAVPAAPTRPSNAPTRPDSFQDLLNGPHPGFGGGNIKPL